MFNLERTQYAIADWYTNGFNILPNIKAFCIPI